MFEWSDRWHPKAIIDSNSNITISIIRYYIHTWNGVRRYGIGMITRMQWNISGYKSENVQYCYRYDIDHDLKRSIYLSKVHHLQESCDFLINHALTDYIITSIYYYYRSTYISYNNTPRIYFGPITWCWTFSSCFYLIYITSSVNTNLYSNFPRTIVLAAL